MILDETVPFNYQISMNDVQAFSIFMQLSNQTPTMPSWYKNKLLSKVFNVTHEIAKYDQKNEGVHDEEIKSAPCWLAAEILESRGLFASLL